jgi:deoxyribonuclease-4
MGGGEEAGLGRVAEALDLVHGRTQGSGVWIDLETTAGQGSSLGCRFEHLGRIFELVSQPERLGICVDTCHIFAAGYSLGTLEEYHGTIEELDQTVGLGRLRVWHLNDSCRDRGSRVDRHAAIGEGKIGLEPFRYVVNDVRFDSLPLILETPKGVAESGEDLDARNLRVLRELIESPQPSRAAG